MTEFTEPEEGSDEEASTFTPNVTGGFYGSGSGTPQKSKRFRRLRSRLGFAKERIKLAYRALRGRIDYYE